MKTINDFKNRIAVSMLLCLVLTMPARAGDPKTKPGRATTSQKTVAYTVRSSVSGKTQASIFGSNKQTKPSPDGSDGPATNTQDNPAGPAAGETAAAAVALNATHPPVLVPDAAFISVLSDLSRELKNSPDIDKLDDCRKAAAHLAEQALSQALAHQQLPTNRILSPAEKDRAEHAMKTEAWDSGDIIISPDCHASLSAVWAKKVDGLMNLAIAGNCGCKPTPGGGKLGEFVFVLNGKSVLARGFDIQSQADVNFWLGKITNFTVDTACCNSNQSATENTKEHPLVSNVVLKSVLTEDKRKYLDDLSTYNEQKRLLALKEEAERWQAKEKARIQIEAEVKAKAEAKALAEAEAKAQAEAKAKAEAEAKALAEAEAKAQAEAKAKAEAEAKALAEAEAKAQAEAKAKAEAEAKALAEAEAKAQAEAKARVEAEAKAQAEAKARVEAEAKAQAEAKALSEAKAKAEAEAKAEAKTSLEAKAPVEGTIKLQAATQPSPDTQKTTWDNPAKNKQQTALAEVAPTTTHFDKPASSSPQMALSDPLNLLQPDTGENQKSWNRHPAPPMTHLPGATSRVLLPDKAIAGQFLTAAVVKPNHIGEALVELTFNGATQVTGPEGQALFMVPEDSIPGPTLQVELTGHPEKQPATISVIQPLSAPAEPQLPRVDLVSPVVQPGSIITIDGHHFDGVAERNQVIVDETHNARILVASPVQLKAELPGHLPPGLHTLLVSTNDLKSNRGQFELITAEVQPDPKEVSKDILTKLIVRVEGTRSPTHVHLKNHTPEIVHLSKGNEQHLTTPGGLNNTLTVAAQRVRKGSYHIQATIE